MNMLRALADTIEPLRVAVDLVYTTDASCRSVTELPSSSDALVTWLLPASAAFRGNMQLSKAASGDGCALYLTVKGAVSAAATDFQDAFDVARSMHQEMVELLSAKGLENVALARTAVVLDGDKLLTVSLKPEDEIAAESVLTVQQGTCTELLDAVQSNAELLPSQVETSVLDVVKQTDADEAADCAVSLEVAALTPRLSTDADAFQLLKAVDEKMEKVFATQIRTTLTSVNVRLQVPSDMTQNLAVEMGSVAASPSSNVTYNPPSYEEALGIFALVAVLVAMMMGVVIQKKRNDQRSRERYERASRAAQIRRVSIRMSQYDQEENDDIGEEDSLL
ncbi:Hypothetical protein PHPALM_6475 [Phytophthora palmivora]|uniref:Uncharacterized protein n=1 Tax=Phytophthora palmivora TaxID=4796 RepID=A0A2P4YEQ2_9STRA|nr:Hypothetical protein PHPALM_6475 [Phytophthora palmivora]